MRQKKDNIYASPLQQIIDFQFDEKVVDVFPDMIQRSVPGYAMIISNIGLIAAKYATPDSNCYDLGSSLGAATFAMRQRIDKPNCSIIAVDSSKAMVERAKTFLAIDKDKITSVKMLCADIREVAIENASVVVLNFTLQFIPPAEREMLIQKIYNGLNPNGALILSEKISFTDAESQSFYEELHSDFKRANGYSDLEISQKRSAIEKVMIPEPLSLHKKRLYNARFKTIELWFQCFNFVSMVAVK